MGLLLQYCILKLETHKTDMRKGNRQADNHRLTVPKLLGTKDWFHGRQFFHRPGEGGWFQDGIYLHSLLHQLHLRSSGIRSWRLRTPARCCQWKGPLGWLWDPSTQEEEQESHTAWGGVRPEVRWQSGVLCQQGGYMRERKQEISQSPKGVMGYAFSQWTLQL